MSRSKLIVLHGMGFHSAEATKQTVIDAANRVLRRYTRFKEVRFEDYVHVIGIGYDDIFEDERKRLVENNTKVSDFLKTGKIAPDFVKKLVELEARIGEDKFFTTHALDVIFYQTLLGEQVRLRVVREIADVWKEWRHQDMHIMAHSLGTAVLHDTLHKAYTSGIGGIKFSPVTHKFDSLWMLANVSNLTFSITPLKIKFNPYKSVVRPSYTDDGCTEEFYNYWHVLDPFTLFHKFAPANDGSWVPEVIYDSLYKSKPDGLKYIGSTLNPHDLSEYISNPYVSYRFMSRMLPRDVFDPTEAEIKQADAKYKNLEGDAKKIAEYVKKIKSIDDIAQLVEAIKGFEDYLDQLKTSV